MCEQLHEFMLLDREDTNLSTEHVAGLALFVV